MSNTIVENKGFDIIPCEQITDIANRVDFKKLELAPSQKIQMGGLMQQIPAVLATETLGSCYMIQFQKGIPNACQLMKYKNGGRGTPIQGADGKIVAHASLNDLTAQAAVLGAFNAMAIVSGQYFLAQINSELKVMNQNINKILEFLYGDKKAELVSEVSFVKSAYQNYSFIMEHEQQRFATLVNLQEAKKVAMKDIEFYMSDLDSTSNTKNDSDLPNLVDKMYQTKECLELAMQLYVMSSLLEIYYAQNYDIGYISNIEEESVVYISKCEKRILRRFSQLLNDIRKFKETPLKKIGKSDLEKKVNLVVDSFSQGTESETIKLFRTVLHVSEEKTEYYVAGDGDLYLKTS